MIVASTKDQKVHKMFKNNDPFLSSSFEFLENKHKVHESHWCKRGDLILTTTCHLECDILVAPNFGNGNGCWLQIVYKYIWLVDFV
jgi:hypothetical protein